MVYPLTMENKFHSLSNNNDVDVIRLIIATLLRSIVDSVLNYIKCIGHTFITKFRAVIQRTGREIGHYEMVVLHHMGLDILRGMLGPFYRASIVDARGIVHDHMDKPPPLISEIQRKDQQFSVCKVKNEYQMY